MAAPSASTPRPREPGSGLTDDLITPAGTPDDGSVVPALLRSISRSRPFATAGNLPLTVNQNDGYVPVAMSSQAALARGCCANHLSRSHWPTRPARTWTSVSSAVAPSSPMSGPKARHENRQRALDPKSACKWTDTNAPAVGGKLIELVRVPIRFK